MTAPPVDAREEAHGEAHGATPAPPAAQRTPLNVPRRLLIDGALVAAFFIAATILGTLHIRNWAGGASFYQEYFAAAVSEACGMGFRNLDQHESPALDAFLRLQQDAVSCDEVRNAASSDPSAFQIGHRYLMGSAALIWRFTGVSWKSLAPLFGTLFGLTVAIGYLIGRVAFGRVLSSLLALALMGSGINLGLLPLLRDYAKAPFFLGLVALLALIAVKPLRARWVLVASAAAGLVVGIGLGFRTDLLICVPAAMFAILVFMPGSLRRTWLLRVAAVAVFVVAFGISGVPLLLRSMKGGGATSHVALLGFAERYNAALGVDTPYYTWVERYSDTHVNALLNMYAHWKTGRTKPLQIQTPEYEVYGREYFFLIMQHFPADMLTRAYGAILRTIDLPISGFPGSWYLDPNDQPIGIAHRVALGRYLWMHGWLVHLLRGIPVLCAIATLLILAAHRLRYALFLTFLLGYFGGYTILQFSLRHVFHFEIFGLWMMAFVAHALFLLLRFVRRHREGDVAPLDAGSWRKALAFAVVLIVCITTPLMAARVWQEQHVRDLMIDYAYAPKERLAYETVPGSSADRVMLRLTDLRPPAAGEMRGDYLVVQMYENHAPAILIFRGHGVTTPVWEQTSTYSVPMPPHAGTVYPSTMAKFFFPAYTGPEAVFDGIEVPANALPSIEGVYRVSPSSRLPLLLFLDLRPGWEKRPHHQELIGAERRHRVAALHGTDPALLKASPDVLLPGSALTSSGNIVAVSNGTLHARGFVDATNSTFAQFAAHDAKRGDALVVEGSLSYGCLTALVVGAGDYLPAQVTEPGPFRIVIQVPQNAKYTPILTTDCYGPSEIRVTRTGWISGDR